MSEELKLDPTLHVCQHGCRTCYNDLVTDDYREPSPMNISLGIKKPLLTRDDCRGIAARIWCDFDYQEQVMDVNLCEQIAEQLYCNQEGYRDALDRVIECIAFFVEWAVYTVGLLTILTGISYLILFGLR